jgi:hypothetical protein
MNPDLKKPVQRKYDKRCKSPKSIAAIQGAVRSEKQLGRKPNWMKHLSRNAALKILQQFDSIASPAEIYAWCWENKKIDIMVGMREYVWNRLEGRPFLASSPADEQKHMSLLQDSRLQVAIEQLVIAPRTAKEIPTLPDNEPLVRQNPTLPLVRK